MEFKIAERYYPVTLTKRSQFCKAKQFFNEKFGNIIDNRQHKNKNDKFFLSRQLYVQSQQQKYQNKVFLLDRNFKPKVNVFYFLHIKLYCSNIAARNSKTKCYKELHLSRCSGTLSTGLASIFRQGGRKSDFLYYHELHQQKLLTPVNSK